MDIKDMRRGDWMPGNVKPEAPGCMSGILGQPGALCLPFGLALCGAGMPIPQKRHISTEIDVRGDSTYPGAVSLSTTRTMLRMGLWLCLRTRGQSGVSAAKSLHKLELAETGCHRLDTRAADQHDPTGAA